MELVKVEIDDYDDNDDYDDVERFRFLCDRFIFRLLAFYICSLLLLTLCLVLALDKLVFVRFMQCLCEEVCIFCKVSSHNVRCNSSRRKCKASATSLIAEQSTWLFTLFRHLFLLFLLFKHCLWDKCMSSVWALLSAKLTCIQETSGAIFCVNTRALCKNKRATWTCPAVNEGHGLLLLIRL